MMRSIIKYIIGGIMEITENEVSFELPQMGICCACVDCTCSPCMCLEDDCCAPGMFIPKEYGLLVEL